MGSRDPRIDTYIDKSADFAKPILIHLRELVHTACPDVEEGIKWGFPHFMHKGILCSMASFKGHCAFGFWKRGVLSSVMGEDASEEAMGQFGRITALSDLPKDRMMIKYIKTAVRLNNEEIKTASAPAPRPKEKRDLDIPDYFMAALKKNKKALKTFEGFSYSSRKEYVEWVTEAKTEATRAKRLETAVEWMAEGKVRHWKYQKC
jgi:uncharacterized protein YdeI (YjbR/CyaY-like superfamily)